MIPNPVDLSLGTMTAYYKQISARKSYARWPPLECGSEDNLYPRWPAGVTKAKVSDYLTGLG